MEPEIDEVLDAIKNGKNLSMEKVFKKYEPFRITTVKPIPHPEPIVKIQGIDICTAGNLSMITGPEKSAKTAFANIIISAAIATANGGADFHQIELAGNTDGKAIITIDTEQSEYHSFRNFKSGVLKRVGRDEEPGHLYTYNIRSLTIDEYAPMLTALFKAANEKHGGIFLCVLDGGADFVNDTNDGAESRAKVAFFSQLAMKYSTAIIQIVHLNPGSDKERGHYGSELRRKCESVLSIKKEGDVSMIEGRLLRSGGISDFEPMRLQFDKSKGYHVFINTDKTAKGEPGLHDLAKLLFSERRTWQDATNLIMKSEGCKDRKAAKILADITKANFIQKTIDGRNVFYELSDDEKTPL